MKLHLIKQLTLEHFAKSHPNSKPSLNNWLNVVKYSDWNSPKDILDTFRSADLLGNGSNRVVFDIGGNNFRMICKYYFGDKQVHLFICWMGTHSEYDKICKNNSQYSINIY